MHALRFRLFANTHFQSHALSCLPRSRFQVSKSSTPFCYGMTLGKQIINVLAGLFKHHLPESHDETGSVLKLVDPAGIQIQGVDVELHESLVHELINIYPTTNVDRHDVAAGLNVIYKKPAALTQQGHDVWLAGETLKIHRLMGHVRRAWRRFPEGQKPAMGRLKKLLDSLQPEPGAWPELPKAAEDDWPDLESLEVVCDDVACDVVCDDPQGEVIDLLSSDEQEPSQPSVDPQAVAAELAISPPQPSRYRALKVCLRKPAGVLKKYEQRTQAPKVGQPKPKSKTKSKGSSSKPKSKTKSKGSSEKATPASQPGSFHWLLRHKHTLDILPPQLRFQEGEPRGEFSYSVPSKRSDGIAIQVLLAKKAFFLKGAAMLDGRTTVAWGPYGNPTAAFRAIQKAVPF